MSFSAGKNLQNNINTTEAQTLQNKTLDNTNAIDGAPVNNSTITNASIESPSRLDMKKDTLANLQTYAASATNGQLVYATDVKKTFQVVDAALVEVGSGSGGLDVYYTEFFDTLQDVSGFSQGNNASFLGGGTLQGTLALDSVSPISGDKSLTYTQAAGSLNDYFASELINIDLKQQNNDSGMTLYFQYDGNDDDLKFVVYDVTNGAELTSGVELVKTTDKAQRYALSFYVPATCTQIRWGAQVLVENIGAVLEIDDVEITSNPFVYKDLITPRTVVRAAGNGGESITANVTDIPFTEVEDDFDLWDGDSFTVPSDGDYQIDGQFSANAATNALPLLFLNGSQFRVSGQGDNSASRRPFNFSEYLQKDDVISIRSNSNITLGTSTNSHYIHIQRIPESTEHVITPAKSTLTDWTAFTPSSSQGYTSPNFVSQYKRVGDSLEAIIRFDTGGSVASEAQIGLPTGLTIGPFVGIGTHVVGTYVRSASSAAAGGFVLATEGDSYVNLSAATAFSNTATSGLTPANGNATADSETLSLTFRVPIEEWSSDATFLAAIPTPKTAYIKDVKPSGTGGGSFTGGSWQTRDINTLEGDSNILSLSSNQIVLKPGKYEIDIEAPAFQVGDHKLKLRNITDSTDQILGAVARSVSSDSVVTMSRIIGQITITESKTFEVQHYADNTKTVNGFGEGLADGTNEVYLQGKITKVG